MAASIYAENSIIHQTGVELVCLLYSESITRIAQAINALESGGIPERATAVGGAMAIIVELQTSLDADSGGELTRELARLYEYVQDRLIVGHAEQQLEPFEQAQQILETLLSGWQDCRSSLDEEKKVDVAETVLAADGGARAWTV